MLVHGGAEPEPIVSPWYDMRVFPLEMPHQMARSLKTRRFLKAHLPYEALPVYEGVKFVHVARDGRDAAMSMHNHLIGFTPLARERLSEINRADPKFGDAFPTTPADPATYFRQWLDDDGGALGDPRSSFFHFENSYWAARRGPNMLLTHFNDLKADLPGEMRRIADFLEMGVDETAWPAMVEAARFEAMRAQGDTLMPWTYASWDEGPRRFLHKGTNERWKGVVSEADLADYAQAVRARFTPTLAAWLEGGRLVAGEPALTPD
jgi:aryl sulfotransferase